jgi:hypothetical protein
MSRKFRKLVVMTAHVWQVGHDAAKLRKGPARQISWVFTARTQTNLRQRSALEKMRATQVRRLIS